MRKEQTHDNYNTSKTSQFALHVKSTEKLIIYFVPHKIETHQIQFRLLSHWAAKSELI